MKVRDIMTSFVISATPDTTLRTALGIMDEKDIRHLPVVEKDQGGIVGMLSASSTRAIASVLAEVGAGRAVYEEMLERPVSDVLQTRFTRARDIVVLRPQDSVRQAIDALIEHSLSSLPVLGDAGEVVGIVSYVDVLEALKDHAGS